jgi:hypothetical protein
MSTIFTELFPGFVRVELTGWLEEPTGSEPKSSMSGSILMGPDATGLVGAVSSAAIAAVNKAIAHKQTGQALISTLLAAIILQNAGNSMRFDRYWASKYDLESAEFYS